MKLIIFLTLSVFPRLAEPKTVFVCDSPGAKRYHLKEKCRGLTNCTYRIIKVTEETAKVNGKTLCHWEN
ncbi:hypothetical protein FPZ42_07105 [Mucilaginibacter achroorhodeus]|uniref:Uncharacterized protein n=1 Tax=Mucilaginibacter achroorhodeus TaxID=2599294 RepID=A0A563U658_9SPHI|nr:hypothetical protein FPZ42_07105 [Mucilaginibacter achroorhodeus]